MILDMIHEYIMVMIVYVLQMEEMTKTLLLGKVVPIVRRSMVTTFTPLTFFPSSYQLSHHSPLYCSLMSDLPGAGVSGLIMYLNKS